MTPKAIAVPLGFCFALSALVGSGVWSVPAPTRDRETPAKPVQAKPIEVKPIEAAAPAGAERASGLVVSRSDIPFDVPAIKAPAQPEPSPSRDGDLAVRRSPPPTATVRPGDSLWRIARKKFGKGGRYTQIQAANSGRIRNPRKIYPGQVFVMPKDRD